MTIFGTIFRFHTTEGIFDIHQQASLRDALQSLDEMLENPPKISKIEARYYGSWLDITPKTTAPVEAIAA
jgi:hypothetical protein